MAEVFLAAMVGAGGISKLAVLKRIWPDLAGDPQFVAMFLDEARLSVRMAHPNLVQTYEIIEEDDRLAIAMEYLDGQPLGRVLNRLHEVHPLSLPQRLRIVTKLLAGLDYVHELTDYDGTPLAVVHRDVSPHNVFITYDGNVKLVDFGVAKNLASAYQTRPGTLKGKFAYMAPEQFVGQPADRRSDIFSTGVILWEMLAQRRFWTGVADNQIAGYLISDLPLPALPPELGLPIELEAICARALHRDPDQRYATAAEMEMELESSLTNTPEASARLLGKVVAEGFAAERAARQILIDQHLRRLCSGSYPFRSGSYPMIPGGACPTPSSSLSPVATVTPAPSKRLPWPALALAAALPCMLLLALLSGRGGVNRDKPSPSPSAPASSARSDPAPPAPAKTFAPPARVVSAPPLPVIGRSAVRSATPPQASSGAAAAGGELPRRSSRRDRRLGVPPSRTGTINASAAPAPTAMPPAPVAPGPSRAVAGADPSRPSLAGPRPIEVANPFSQRALPHPRPIDTANPFLSKDPPAP